MRDAVIGLGCGVVLLVMLCVSGTGNGPTLQGVFEDVEKYKADKLMREQVEQAKRTIEQQKSTNENLRVKQQ